MFSQTIFLILLAFVHLSTQDQADPSYLCSKLGVRYSKGCSGFAADALGQSFKMASSYSFGNKIEGYSVASGTLIGFDGHLGFYYNGQCGGRYCRYIDVNGAGGKVRCLNSYGRTVFFRYY